RAIVLISQQVLPSSENITTGSNRSLRSLGRAKARPLNQTLCAKIQSRRIRMEFEGKVALVTGAGTGNGEAIAERLLAGGASVVLVSRRIEPVEPVSRRIDPKGARTLAIEADVRDPIAMETAVKQT